MAPLKKIIEDVCKSAERKSLPTSGKFKEECELVCDYWLDYAERHQIDEFCRAYLKQGEGSHCAVSAFSTRLAS